ncbi:FMN-dependent dehydrogenase, includes L-lactate dehydrogenase and type II isopentenyl diphosphate isomerase [Pedococcus dokdonensis]|uniref:FMN-dependent dehydrogenase, includes L-lactate dehydrogenase and type II isopentenyl diphosphate isomerase n=1 Tax=Pedococcus dokdonensis TaxID=443156 RepID=A0A1H0V949_9MICO|nr:alpha-hydroxy-acid oxidizing protein [Pedococcus dokdonensis]SDP74626.1 FMN-dependent dehydrogenase, includes L-lactate dehydrogenase and type II isopentenyl diphosphate isomerase [Pedococcus dokdonensis]
MQEEPQAPGPAHAGPGRTRQSLVYRAGVLGSRPTVPTDFAELERRAQAEMSPRAWAYVAGAAGEGTTARANRVAFERHRIVPRMLPGRVSRDLSVELLGRRLPAPVLLAPVGAAGLVRRDSDTAIGAAAAELGLPYILSNQGCSPMEDVAAAMASGPRWFQLYWSTDEPLVDSLLARAEASGAEAVVVTLDTTMLGWRPQDLNLGSLPFSQGIGIAQYTSDPRFQEIVAERVAAKAAGNGGSDDVKVTLGALRSLLSISREHPGDLRTNLRSPVPRAAVETFLDIYSNPGLTWDRLATLRDRTSLPFLVKGVLHPDDAARAVEIGASGIVVSNHGGRQVDGAIASLDALPAVRSAVGPDLPVVLDSGVRTGSDVVKALALGADAVAIGRPYVYGLALAGRDGVRDVLANIVAELDLTMGLSGIGSVAELGPELLATAP